MRSYESLGPNTMLTVLSLVLPWPQIDLNVFSCENFEDFYIFSGIESKISSDFVKIKTIFVVVVVKTTQLTENSKI